MVQRKEKLGSELKAQLETRKWWSDPRETARDYTLAWVASGGAAAPQLPTGAAPTATPISIPTPPLMLPTWLASPTHSTYLQSPSVARMERDKRMDMYMGATTGEELLREDQQKQQQLMEISLEEVSLPGSDDDLLMIGEDNLLT